MAEVLDNLHRGLFKPNCALGASPIPAATRTPVLLADPHDAALPDPPAVMVDFLVRHAFLTPENEPHLIDISRRLHATLAVPGIVGR